MNLLPLLCLLVLDGGEAEPIELSPRELLWTELRASRDPESDADEVIADRIAESGLPILDPLLEVLERRRIPGLEEEDEEQVLSRPQREILVGVLESLDADAVRSRLRDWTLFGPSSERSEAALYAYAACGGVRDVPEYFALCGDVSEGLERDLSDAFRYALSHTLRRSARAYDELERQLEDMPEAFGLPVVFALGEAGSEAGVELLLSLFERRPVLRNPAMTQAGRLGPSTITPVQEAFAERARDWLVHGSNTQSRTAAVYLAQVADETSVPVLIDLLGAESQGVRDNALFALQKLSGLTYPPKAEFWRLWYEGELEWFRKQSRRMPDELTCANDSRVAKAVQDIAKRRLRRNELANWLLLVEDHPKPHLRTLVCHALAQIGSKRPIPDLIRLLEDPEEHVRVAAQGALRAITGQDHGPSPEDWSSSFPAES